MDLSSEGGEGLNENGGLDGHVEASGNSGSLQWLGWSVLGTHGHESWHLILGKGDFLASELGEGDVGNLVSWLGLGHCECVLPGKTMELKSVMTMKYEKYHEETREKDNKKDLRNEPVIRWYFPNEF